MPNPQNYDSRVSFFAIVDDTVGTSRDISAHITSIDGLPGRSEVLEVTTLGNTGRIWIRHLYSANFTLEGYYDNVASTGFESIIQRVTQLSTGTTFNYGPTGNSSGASPVNRRWTGQCFNTNYEITTRVGSVVSWRAEFVLNQTLTYTTFT